jgi:nucleotide-binding universal stress UspA family protein
MKILATFDGSPFSEASIPTLTLFTSMPNVEIAVHSVAEVTVAFDEDAIRQRRQQLETYLTEIVNRLPKGPKYRVSTDVAMYPIDAGAMVVERARSEHPDMIVMATHGRSGVVRIVLGSVAERVVRSGVAPVMLVQPRSGG